MNPADTSLQPGTPLERLGLLASLLGRNLLSLRTQSAFAVLTMSIGALGLSVTFLVGHGALTGLWRDLASLCGHQAMLLPDTGPDLAMQHRRAEIGFTTRDFLQLRAGLAPGARATEFITRRSITICGSTSLSLPVDGVTAESLARPVYQPVAGRSLPGGAGPTNEGGCLLTLSAAHRFHFAAPESQIIVVEGRRFQVIGFVPDPPEVDPRFSARVVIPYPLAADWWGRPGFIDFIMLYWDKPEQFDEVIASVRRALDACRAPGAYYIDAPQARLSERRAIISNTMVLCSVQAAFTIMVAAVGMINVMLVGVIQRSREYAIRLVCGAELRVLTLLVVAESLVLSVVSAFLGILVGAVVAAPVCKIIVYCVPGASGLEPEWSWQAVIFPLVVCSLCGLAAGIEPARRAARVDVLEVLRND